MIGIHKIREQLHAKILRLRSVEGVTSSILFERLWSDSNNRQREEVLEYIENGNRISILAWLRSHESLDIAEVPFSRLKELSRKYHIRNYSRLTKVELIRAIKEIEDGSKQS